MNETAQQRYLRTVRTELADLPRDRREMVLADLQAHIEEVLDRGSNIDQALASLGPAGDLAARAREEMSDGVPSLAAGKRATRTLVVGAVLIGTLTALMVAFAAPFWSAIDRSETGVSPAEVTIIQPGGSSIALIGLVPVVLAALTMVLPRRAGQVVLFVLAGVMTAALVLGFTLADWYLPFIAQLWVCALVPIAVSRGFDLARSRGWRIALGLVLVLPTGLILLRSIGAPDRAGLLYTIAFALSLALAVLIVVGVRVTYLLLSGVGVALMIGTTFIATFMLPAWWLGGAYFVLGSTGFAATWQSRVRRGNP